MTAFPDIVVTGVGLVTPLGLDRETSWANLLAGRTGIRAESGTLVARVPDFSANGARSRAGDFAVMAAREAMTQAGLDASSADIGCAIGQSKPLLQMRSAECGARNGEESDSSSIPYFALHTPNSAFDPALALSSFTGWSLEAVVKSHLRLEGPSANVAAACATGVAAIDAAAGWIWSGRCEAALAGAAESSLSSFYEAGFRQMGVLAGGESPTSIRPFDRDRCGFAMGEGGAVIALESEASARRRGARVLARLSSVRLRHSFHDPLRFDGDGGLIESLIRSVCGAIRPDYVNAHGTGTRINDAAEARGLRRAFGDGASGVTVGSTKASTGHLLGAAGAVEAAFAALSVRDGVAPPSLHVDSPDENVDFAIAGRCAARPVSTALSLSYGFGGQMAAVLFSRP